MGLKRVKGKAKGYTISKSEQIRGIAMAERYVIKVEYPVRAKRGEARGKGGLLQKCVIFTGSTKEEALRDAKAWEEVHNASPYGEIIARGWDAI